MDFGSADRLHGLGTVTLVPRPVSEEARARLELLRSRRTSRRPYDARPVPAQVVAAATEVANAGGHTFRTSADRRTVRRLVHINQATLFSDLRNDAVYGEIMTWLRFSKEDARDRADGLSAEAMLMPGGLLRFAMAHRGLWDAPVIGGAIRAMYLNTMRGVRQLGWLEGPFAGPADYIEAGRTFMRLWLELTAHGVRLHPFGTVITNPGSHRAFAEEVGRRRERGPDGLDAVPVRVQQDPARGAPSRPATAMLLGAAAMRAPPRVHPRGSGGRRRAARSRTACTRTSCSSGPGSSRCAGGSAGCAPGAPSTSRRGEVPAYRAFLAEHGRDGRLRFKGPLTEAFRGVPEMDKESYVKRWSILDAVSAEALPRRGVVVDESSGSSGKPTSWVRGTRGACGHPAAAPGGLRADRVDPARRSRSC